MALIAAAQLVALPLAGRHCTVLAVLLWLGLLLFAPTKSCFLDLFLVSPFTRL